MNLSDSQTKILWVLTYECTILDAIELLAVCCTIVYLAYSHFHNKVQIPRIVSLQLVLLLI